MKYPALELLLQGYLTLDWPDDYPTAWAAVDEFIAQEGLASELPLEVDRLLDVTRSEDDLSALLVGELGSGYLPESEGFTIVT